MGCKTTTGWCIRFTLISSNCRVIYERNSEIHSGLLIGSIRMRLDIKSPADGILSPNDEISIKFNEPIDLGSINPNANFDIQEFSMEVQLNIQPH